MTEDSAIQIDCVTLQSLCTLPTLWSSSSIQHPGTCPTGSLELAPQEWTRTPPTKPDYRVTSLRTHRHLVLGIPVVGWPLLSPSTTVIGWPLLSPSITSHLVATCPTGTACITLWISRLSPPTGPG